jgi:CheY-like chemotaxis protein
VLQEIDKEAAVMVRKNILIVDDNHDIATMLAEILHAYGLAASGVSSAAACLELLDREPMDVVVTDMAMPDMSGIELCHRLRARHPAPRTMVMSGYNRSADIAAAQQAGALAYLVKPMGAAALAQAIRCVLEVAVPGPDPSGLAIIVIDERSRIAPLPAYAAQQ